MAELYTEASAALLEKANALPRSPGVYLMKDKGVILRITDKR